ncbi:MAG: hypothetical protein HWN67_16565 [Candidatus Helarchaeota archaeon]|nr:hypothetical protein [Candidatus Helarchaeota archaeon]
MTFNLLTLIILAIWITILIIYIKIPLSKFAEERIKHSGFAFLLSFAVLSFVYIEPFFHHSFLFVFASIFIVSSFTFGLIFVLDSPWETKALIPFSIIFDLFLISLVLFYLPTHPTILILLSIWEIIFGIYMFGIAPFLKSIDFRKKFGILLFMIGISITTFGYLSPLIHEIKNEYISTGFTFIAWNLSLNRGLVFLTIFHDLVFFIMSWIAISTFSLLSFLPDAKDPEYEQLRNITIAVLTFTFNSFLISFNIFWIRSILGIYIIVAILIAVDFIIIWLIIRKRAK